MVEFFVKPLERTAGTASVEVGVLPLPLFEVEGRLGQVVQRVLDLGLGRHEWLFLFLVGFLFLGRLFGLGGLFSLGLVGLGGFGLGGGSVGEGVDDFDVGIDVLDLGLVDVAAKSARSEAKGYVLSIKVTWPLRA